MSMAEGMEQYKGMEGERRVMISISRGTSYNQNSQSRSLVKAL